MLSGTISEDGREGCKDDPAHSDTQRDLQVNSSAPPPSPSPSIPPPPSPSSHSRWILRTAGDDARLLLSDRRIHGRDAVVRRGAESASGDGDGSTSVGGSHYNPATAALLLLLCLRFPPSVATCPQYCLCASDIISCSGRNLSMLPFDLPSYATRLDLSHNALTALPTDWIPQLSDRLATLVLSRNSISFIEVNAFSVTPRLLHLDLSSNQLTVLNSSIFTGLKELKELLLFGNQIIQINTGAFSDLFNLQRLYLSGNRLTAFPLGLYFENGGPRNLTFLDLSRNRLSNVPVQSLLSVTRQGGIYLQENPLVCDCAVLALLEYWIWKQYRPMIDFRVEYPCRGDSGPGSVCSQQGMVDMPLKAQTYKVEPGRSLVVPCPGLASPALEGLVVFWVTPRTVVNSSTDDPSAHLKILPNGSLEIQEAFIEDSGKYACVAARGRNYDPYESVEVTVAVGNMSMASSNGVGHRSSAEHFNTAFTTLASCVVSIILVLLYLYLTPCRCRDGPGGGSRGCGGRAIVLCSDPREVESGQRRSNGKRVAFLEPQAENSDTDSPKTPAIYLGHVTTEGILKNGSRTVGQTVTDPGHVA
ncbi:hypothetical protein Q5P01_003374 [Channa striata]|uniref:Ig-like domain-containing protein n=1 Tax=Channa striata TaxID=64152 RepID=A0AA88NFT1_CHASR|nr:hypothetical protein Q5P01_003374 [Channa striata]